ncbi:hypothetical protein TKK_0007218 [Trichogramma kaykai]|uniref:Rab11 family-interacting protein 1 n=1 Tax=Trichogramma kaykai TaxID=54128 RepID=A0ABD2X9D4_9HYME
MWSPTHVQVVVQRAKNLITKGKNKTNDCFVTIGLGKDKYQTSVKEKAASNVEWHEECELRIPEHGNTAEIVLTVLHRNIIGDEFLGTVRIPLAKFDIYEMPKNRWFTLEGKPGKEKTKERGELEVRVGFIVKAGTGSLSDLTKKERHKSSLGQLSSKAQNFGGSLLSIASIEKRKSLKKLAKSIGHKVSGKSRSKNKLDDICDEGEFPAVVRGLRPRTAGQEHGEADPGVISDEDDDEFTFDDLSHKSSTSSINSAATPRSGRKLTEGNRTESPLARFSDANLSQTENEKLQQNRSATLPPSKPPRFALNNSGNGGSPGTGKLEKQQEDEWGQKLYGMQTSNALKRWDQKRMSPKVSVEDSITESNSGPVSESRNNVVPSPIPRPRSDVVLTSVADSKRETSNKQSQQRPQTPTQQQQQQQIKSNKDKQREQLHQQLVQKQLDIKKKDKQQKFSSERIIIGGEENTRLGTNDLISQTGKLPRELAEQFEGKSREDLIELILNLQLDVADKKKRLHDLEDYIDALLLRVIECSPVLLQNPFQPARRLSSPGHQ